MSEFFRKRLIPDECINLSDDELLYKDDDFIIMRWHTFRPKEAFSWGISVYCLKEGHKISKFFKEDNSLAYIYCDIIDTEYDKNNDRYIFTDLLADVIIENDGQVHVVDVDELADAFESGILSKELLCVSLRRLDALLSKVYSTKLEEYTKKMDAYL